MKPYWNDGPSGVGIDISSWSTTVKFRLEQARNYCREARERANLSRDALVQAEKVAQEAEEQFAYWFRIAEVGRLIEAELEGEDLAVPDIDAPSPLAEKPALSFDEPDVPF